MLGVVGVSLSEMEELYLSQYPGFDNKILTSARNGELIMWDLNKLGPSKFGGCFTCLSNLHTV